MGSSGGGSYSQPKTPAPPSDMIAGPGQTSPFNPQWVNFLGDTNTPSTGLTPEMLGQIDSMYSQPQQPPGGGAAGGEDRGLLAQIMARLDAMQQGNRRGFQPRGRGPGGGGGGGGYTTSGREGAGGFGSRSSSASRAGGGLY